MERVGVRELRQNLSVYLRRVEAGETLEVTERGRPVAVLQPLSATRDQIERHIRAGRLRPGRQRGRPFTAPSGRLTTAGSDALAAQRDER
jgi:prevent-host-death family protein